MANPGSIGSAMPASEDTQARRVADLERDLRELGPSIARSFAPVIATLTTQQATLATQQATLADQQAQLTAQVATLAAQVALQVQPASGHSGVASGALTSTPSEITRCTFTVPSGYTRAQVFGTVFVSVYNTGNAADNIRAYLDINGAYSSTPTINSLVSFSGAGLGSSYAATLTGLTSGSTFYVRGIVYNQTGNANQYNGANVDATVLFLR